MNSALRERASWPGPAGAAAVEATHPEPTRVYLRRYPADTRRPPRYARITIGLALLAALLFVKVWECTVANSLSMERDRLRIEVRALRNRIQLSSDLRDRAALLEGVDPKRFQAEGFVAPDPSRIIDIDLAQPMSRAIPPGGVAARLGSWLRNVAPFRAPPTEPEAESVPVRAKVIP